MMLSVLRLLEPSMLTLVLGLTVNEREKKNTITMTSTFAQTSSPPAELVHGQLQRAGV